ncbi:MAG TPA: hypothetical protein VF540_13270 [Segetibacter sp.]
MKTFRFCRTAFFALISLCALSACSNSYIKSKTVTQASAYPAAIEQANRDNRSFILHSGVNVYTITSYQLNKEKQKMDVQLNKLDSLRIVNVSDGESKRSRPKKGESPLINEIHIYTKDSVSYTLDEPHTIPMEKLARIDLVGKG